MPISRFAQLFVSLLLLAPALVVTHAFASQEEEEVTSAVPYQPTPDQPNLDVPSPPAKALQAALPEGPQFGPILPTTAQPAGNLSGRIVYMSGGHGWNWGGTSWALDRPLLNMMVEDFGNVDQLSAFAYYCFNAGATVVPFRPVGNQTNEVVLDNDDPGVAFAGAWAGSSSSIYYGQPGDAVAYRFATAGLTESATATYTPNFPQAGYYPVYTWVLHSHNRINQLYRINHTGGQSLVRVPHHMVGNGWVYLGTYYFNAGSSPAKGAVVISNLAEGSSASGVVIADAIRFGNGMGDLDFGSGVSGYPREEESSLHWIQKSLGVGQSTTITESGNVRAPTRMAADMNREQNGSRYQRVYVSFHSNAGGGRGVVALWNDNTKHPGTGTSNQFRLAQILGTEVNSDMIGLTSLLEVPWFNRGGNITYSHDPFAYGEINNTHINDEFDATIVEVAFHDNDADARLMRDPKVRNWVARSTYQGVVRYMVQYGGIPLNFLPEPPVNVRAVATDAGVRVSWNTPVTQAGSGTPTAYVVYVSEDGYGFRETLRVEGITNLQATVSGLARDVDYYFRVSASNNAGESLPSETVGCRPSSNPKADRVLVVNAFSRFNRFLNLRQTPARQDYHPPGHGGNTGTMERVLPGRVNSFDYVVPHGKAISAAGYAFDSCQNTSIVNGHVQLTNYTVVIWACGNESVAEKTFSAPEQTYVRAYLAAGGSLLASGSDIAHDLGRASGPSATDREFLETDLRAALFQDDAASYLVLPQPGGFLAGLAAASVGDASRGIYWVPTPDAFALTNGSAAALHYANGQVAAVQYEGVPGSSRVILMGFPFETISSAGARAAYMSRALGFLTPVRVREWELPPAGPARLLVSGPPGQYAVQLSADLKTWSTLETVAITNSPAFVEATFPGGQPSGFLRVQRLP